LLQASRILAFALPLKVDFSAALPEKLRFLHDEPRKSFGRSYGEFTGFCSLLSCLTNFAFLLQARRFY
jgi:hypothetical protein